MITAERIQKSYDRYAQNYDAGTGLQRSLADKLINAIQSDNVGAIHELPLQVLDVGCGTGYLLEKIEKIGTDTELGVCPYFLGCDISFGMLNCARNKIQSADYVQANAQDLPFNSASFDIVVSNAVYQWVRDLKAAFREVKQVLKKPHGRFYFVIFNNNTLWQLQEACMAINVASRNFPDKAALSSSLHEAGFTTDSIETFRYEKYYKDLWELLGALKNIGSTSADNKLKGLGWRAILKQANDLYLSRFGNDNGIPATYEAFLIKAGAAISTS